jgi:DNA-binding protein HU-beta
MTAAIFRGVATGRNHAGWRALRPSFPLKPGRGTAWRPQVKPPVGNFHTAFGLHWRELTRKNDLAMNKAELVDAVQKSLGKEATKRAAEEAVAAVLDAVVKGIKKDKKVQIIGFGTFEVKKRAARIGRNPKTGESMKIAASKNVGFKASSTLKAGL